MAARVIAQVVITGVSIVGKAFAVAYRQAAINATHRGTAAAAAGGKSNSKDALTRKTGITTEEAYQILGVKADMPMEEIVKKYEHLFKVNDTAHSKSFYLQSKVVRAKERLDLEVARAAENAKKSDAEAGPGKDASGSAGPSA
ncbi:MAG: Pam16-domain-containing protein [Piptocephalis tieghemiana]|nr:MAG: Pam16-domain-containing protein [Piptocephalis tieghemiana]